jgi:DNA-3-methyladenine glycosylase I
MGDRRPSARGTTARRAPDPARAGGERCWWCGTDPVYVHYHDTEWGVPVTDDRALWGKLVLDGFQAGLSWITILRKRDAFMRAFADLDPERVARFGARDVTRLMDDAGIIRSRAKIDAAIRNARAWCDVMWQHVDHRTIDSRLRRREDMPTQSAQSAAMARTLKRAGFGFCGPVICYAYMQAVGMVNDHLVTCPRHAACARVARR